MVNDLQMWRDGEASRYCGRPFILAGGERNLRAGPTRARPFNPACSTEPPAQ
jgi:hypothetical protein